jgi:hypothetical protein
MVKEILAERANALIFLHLKKYPECRIADVYKLLFQACLGPEHAITNRETLEDWLAKEWSSISPDFREELYEDLSLHHPIYRINLRPAKAKGIVSSKIIDAFISVGNGFPKKPEVFTNLWEIISRKTRAGQILLADAENIEEFDELVRENDYPAVHHSREYSEAYRPAYRLVGGDI